MQEAHKVDKQETTNKPENAAPLGQVERIVSCKFCKEDGKNIFEFETLDDWLTGFGGDSPITKENACRSNNAVFVDRGYLRLVDIDEAQCMDHGDKRKINYCPFCGRKL